MKTHRNHLSKLLTMSNQHTLRSDHEDWSADIVRKHPVSSKNHVHRRRECTKSQELQISWQNNPVQRLGNGNLGRAMA